MITTYHKGSLYRGNFLLCILQSKVIAYAEVLLIFVFLFWFVLGTTQMQRCTSEWGS